MTHEIRRVDVEKYAYYVNKLRQNVVLGNMTMASNCDVQTAHIKYKWPPYATEWNPTHENFLRTPLMRAFDAVINEVFWGSEYNLQYEFNVQHSITS